MANRYSQIEQDLDNQYVLNQEIDDILDDLAKDMQIEYDFDQDKQQNKNSKKIAEQQFNSKSNQIQIADLFEKKNQQKSFILHDNINKQSATKNSKKQLIKEDPNIFNQNNQRLSKMSEEQAAQYYENRKNQLYQDLKRISKGQVSQLSQNIIQNKHFVINNCQKRNHSMIQKCQSTENINKNQIKTKIKINEQKIKDTKSIIDQKNGANIILDKKNLINKFQHDQKNILKIDLIPSVPVKKVQRCSSVDKCKVEKNMAINKCLPVKKIVRSASDDKFKRTEQIQPDIIQFWIQNKGQYNNFKQHSQQISKLIQNQQAEINQKMECSNMKKNEKNIGYYLYKKGFQLNCKKNQKIQIDNDIKQKQEMIFCTFKPQINKISKTLSRNYSLDGLKKQFDNISKQQINKVDSTIQVMKKQNEQTTKLRQQIKQIYSKNTDTNNDKSKKYFFKKIQNNSVSKKLSFDVEKMDDKIVNQTNDIDIICISTERKLPENIQNEMLKIDQDIKETYQIFSKLKHITQFNQQKQKKNLPITALNKNQSMINIY